MTDRGQHSTPTSDIRVGLTERELRFWIERLRAGGRSARLVPGEIERAVDAALRAGLVLR